MSSKLHTKSHICNTRLFLAIDPNSEIADNAPVRMVNAIVESLDLSSFKKLYRERGRCAYHPKMMLKVIIYAYMNNVYSCRKIEQLLHRDIHYMWLADQDRPDFVTINRFRNRVKEEINNIFTQIVLLLAGRGLVTLDVDGTEVPALLREMQNDVLAGTPIHVDFSEVSLTQKVRVTVPLYLVGEAVGVKIGGGVLEQVLRKVEVECLPTDIAEKF